MVADVAATKLATTAADCGACRDTGPRQEPRHHEGGTAPSSMLRLCVPVMPSSMMPATRASRCTSDPRHPGRI
ncbi:Os08g0131450 [Oryza sativa Japonica Group]|uniref:Os08g0131450 protein n=1 Tax=Oryza sativa subsp. japonica TaxID=39947 RepID=A0A0N7KP84_ORYSJ|nr:Os08g0131450 [Oryza sativa Japonica Group]